jgi:D-lyxose ketol-isomerase
METEKNKELIKFDNAEFYGADGALDANKAKQAIIRFCQYHGYPVFPDFEKNLWVSDYGLGKFTKLGLAAYIFFNSVEDRYMLMDLFILPGQMLPEHWHVEADGNPAKREGWLVRWGLSHIVGIGEPNLGSDVVVPECHWGGKVTVKHEVAAKPGMFVPLAKVESRHWQLGGPEGAIVTEVANVHTGAGVRHTDPVLNEYFLKSL